MASPPLNVSEAAKPVVVIGNFDGVHRGHQAVVAQARRIADANGQPCHVLTFNPHPNAVLGRGTPPQLATLDRRAELLEQHGATHVVFEPFTAELATWTPERFVRDLLVGRLKASAVVVGRNFRFGAKRAGDFAVLEALGAQLGFQTVAAEVAGDAKGPFSSTRVRDAIAAGDLAEATAVLGRPHSIGGVVMSGDRLGRTIGFPTANLGQVLEMLPPHGVYAVQASLDEDGNSQPLGGVMNIGVRPTVKSRAGELRIEVHLFDFERDIYDHRLRVELVARLRGEQKFAGLPELSAQIARDVDAAKAALAGHRP